MLPSGADYFYSWKTLLEKGEREVRREWIPGYPS